MQRHICIHGHFYQPPRENPWLETVEPQDSAYPYHDWNQRITAECYASNAASRILDEKNRISAIVNNYRSISFNFGPTLLGWLAANDPETYRAILDGDQASRERFSGHGSAIAQIYGHAILPLCSARDKRTQVIWGVRDFARRFGRHPEGMWLAETAVDIDSLEVLAEHGIHFTILAPTQAAAVRRIGESAWQEVSGGRIDAGMPYLAQLPSGRQMQLFFFDAAVSHAVAFGGLLSRGDEFARRLLGGFPEGAAGPRLLNVATDGETYGHHHRFGDMALAFAVDRIEADDSARLTNYGEYLELHPPTHEVRIAERTAWSCAHGLGRWQEDCGCSSGRHPDWRQSWRTPLREALDWLRDSLAPEYSREASVLLGDPWLARDDYIDVVLDRSSESVASFLRAHGPGDLGAADRVRALKLLELQRQAMLMYASCGWFFDEISGIETIQVLRHAGRAIQLAEELCGGAWEERFVERLRRAPSNVTEHEDGGAVFEKKIPPARVGLDRIAANHAAGLLFDGSNDAGLSSSFEVDCRELGRQRSGRARLVTGNLRVRSRITLETADFDFAVVHLGDHNLSGAVRPSSPAEAEGSADSTQQEIGSAFTRGDLAGVLRLLEQRYGGTHSLEGLCSDQQRRILDRILDSTLREAEAVHRRLYDQHAPLMRFLKSLDSPSPRALGVSAGIVLNSAIRRELGTDEPDPVRLGRLLQEAREAGVELDRSGLGYAAQVALERLFARLAVDPGRLHDLERLRLGVMLVRNQPLEADLRRVENSYYRMAHEVYPAYREAADRGESAAVEWVRSFDELGWVLRVAGP